MKAEVFSMKRVCVYCGSSPGARKDYLEAAIELAGELAKRGLGLVYGGASVGVMGELARESMRLKCPVTGVIPKSLMMREVGLKELPDLRVVETMHERKALMAELSDAFIAMPGGLGTLDEFFEVMTWGQLGLHSKPCALLNVSGYYDHLLEFIDHAISEKFVSRRSLAPLIIDSDPGRVLGFFESYKPAPPYDKAKDAISSSREAKGS